MDKKTCTVCNIETFILNYHKIYSECKDCNIKRGVKRYFDNEDKISLQQKVYYEKKETNYYRNKRNTDFKDLLRSYAELEKKLKALEEKVRIDDSENN